jgi:hypothetical protein
MVVPLENDRHFFVGNRERGGAQRQKILEQRACVQVGSSF